MANQDLSTALIHQVTRRNLMRIGSVAALRTALPHVAKLRADSSDTAPGRSTAKNCILIWLDGGPSHLETFDIKPEAPAEVRGPLGAISSSVAGIQVSECLPETAKRMHHLAVIRSMTSPLGEHNFGTHYLLTGFKPTPVLEYPSFHAVSSTQRETSGVLPSSIAIPNHRVGGGRMTGHGFLSSEYAPFSLESDPAKSEFRVRDLDLYRDINMQRLSRRNAFRQRLNQFAFDGAETDAQFDQAFRLVSSSEAKQAFDINQESNAVRNRYGRKSVGQCCLLARRLVERGVPFITVNFKGWDTHDDLYTRLKEGFTGAKVPVGLIPSLDLALSALIDDLQDRRLLDETLIVVMGEFGRTPKLNTRGGRDHWPRVFSVALAGGGVQGGQVIGSSDAVGESPLDRPVTPSDLMATIYSLLGIDPSLELRTPDGRPVRITPHASQVVPELIG